LGIDTNSKQSPGQGFTPAPVGSILVLFACAFEFGTFGDSLLQRIRSLRAMVFENQLHSFRAVDEAAAEAIRREFRELYFPLDGAWRQKALADGRQAFEGILHAYGLLA
jgi:hypothetical protein